MAIHSHPTKELHMSREVRRVPLDFKHPTEHNPYWREQQRPFLGRAHVPSRLHGPTERFVGLVDDYPGALADWKKDKQERAESLATRSGHPWDFNVEYHLTGFQNGRDEEPRIRPFYLDDEVSVTVRDEDHLHELMSAQKPEEQPDPKDFMPVFDVPEGELGWCLYETVSEGTPVTPVFATAAELIDHLATVGQDWDQVPLRRASAEAIVNRGGTLGSMVVVAGAVFNSTTDADILETSTS